MKNAFPMDQCTERPSPDQAGNSAPTSVSLRAGTAPPVVCATLTVGTLDARIRFYTSAKGGLYLTAGAGVGTIHAEVAGFGSASETGFSALVGMGYDIRIGKMVSLTPYWNGYMVTAESIDSNIGQFGLAITVH